MILFKQEDPNDNTKSIIGGSEDFTFTASTTNPIDTAKVDIDGDLRVTGDITAFYTSSSDERLKDNIIPIEDSLDKVISISGNTFNWNENSNRDGEDTGVIAQEIEKLGLPGLIKEDKNGYKLVSYQKLIPLLIEAIKELSEDRNIITSKNGVKHRLVVDDDGNLSTEKV